MQRPPLSPTPRSTSTLPPPQPSLHNIPSLSVDYEHVDAQDPDFRIGWLQSFPLFGFSPRIPTDPRFKALSKFRRVTSQHGIEDVSWHDYLLALSLFANVVDRNAKKTLKEKRSLPTLPSASPSTSNNLLTNFFSPFNNRKNSSSSRTHFLSPTTVLPPSSPQWSVSSEPDISEPLHPRRWSWPGCSTDAQIPQPNICIYASSSLSQPPTLNLPCDVYPGSPTISDTPLCKVRTEHVQLLYHMLRHAESIYGLPLNVASAPRLSLTKVKDIAIICRRTGISSSDLCVSQFSTKAFLPAHYVAVDREIKAVVICVRGTATLVDSLTDVAATHDPLKIRRENATSEDDYVEGFGHAGVLRSARNLFTKIRGVTLSAICDNPGFELLITGHSLGAATASVLALIMRDDPDFPRATAVCIAPPPCLTYELAEQTASSTITIVNGPDIVPRLSVAILLPYFATARYVADMHWSQKALLGLGLRRAVINWADLEQQTHARVGNMKKLHEGNRLYIPGKVFQLVRNNEVTRKDVLKNKLLRTRDVTVVPVHRTNFLEVRARERGMFLAHAPFNYKCNLLLALRGMGSGPLKKKFSGGMVIRNLLSLPVSLIPDLYGRKKDGDSLDNLFDRLAEDGSPVPQ